MYVRSSIHYTYSTVPTSYTTIHIPFGGGQRYSGYFWVPLGTFGYFRVLLGTFGYFYGRITSNITFALNHMRKMTMEF